LNEYCVNMNVPSELRFTSEHEWIAVRSDDLVRVGITDYAQDALGDVVFVELPTVGAEVSDGQMFGEVESTKSVSEIYAPLAGTVVAVNDALADNPALLNDDPYGDGWICEVRVSGGDAAALVADLLDADGYRALIEG
jgi:glycine cleavage system H protein